MVGKEVETAAAHQHPQVDQFALEHGAELIKWVSLDGSPLHWCCVTRLTASASPGYTSIMARVPTHWIPWEAPHRIMHHTTPRVWRRRGCPEQVGMD